MPRFFVPPHQITGDTAMVIGDDAAHIVRVLRMQPGDGLTLSDGQGTDYPGHVLSATQEAVEVAIEKSVANASESVTDITLFQAFPKSDKLDFVVQKATELGAVKVVPFLSQRCVSRPKGKALERRKQRLERIAYEAAKQSGRGRIPEIGQAVSFSQALKEMTQSSLALLFYEEESKPLRDYLATVPKTVALMVGPEGGFAPEEVEEAQQAGVLLAGLGSRILRCETAPLVALSAVQYAAGEF